MLPNSRRTLVIDVDHTIADSEDYKYKDAKVIKHARKFVNKWYDEGWHIVIMTARYYGRNAGNINNIYRDGYQELKRWLDKHKFKYHDIIMGKPSAFMYIDNRGENIDNNKGEEDWQRIDNILASQNLINGVD
jgi:capsule biosynthesis phosphatase